MKRKLAHALLWLTSLSALACGLKQVELAPSGDGSGLGNDEITVGEIPDAVRDRFRNDTSEGERAISLLYPPALTIPANVAPITFEWSDKKPMPMKAKPAGDPMAMMMPPMPMGMPMPMMMPGMMTMPGPAEAVVAYELSLRTSRGVLRVITRMQSALVRLSRWRALLHDSAQGTLQVQLRALRANDTIVSADPLELTVWDDTPAGTLHAWSTTAQGLSQASLESTHEQNLTPPSPIAATPSRCVGCHAVSSRDGKRLRLLAAVGGSSTLASWQAGGDALFEHAFDQPAEPAPKDAKPSGYVYGSFDPTATRVAVTQAGHLTILDADNGQVLEESAWPMAITFDYPTWSPDGRWIALVVSAGKPAKDAAVGGMLARVAVSPRDGSLGEPQMLANGMPDEALLAPSYSPDGNWIAFEKRKGMGKNPREGGLWLVAADGGTPIELNTATGERMLHGGASAPAFIETGVPERVFLLFASQRQVGSFVPEEGQRQLFASALDLQLAAAGKDPSRTAFWLPFQQRSSSYLRVQWARALSTRSTGPEVCDDGDDDGDGTVDEECCPPQPDTCGDGLDQDCDGTSDEGCGCAFREVCGNEIDDDCDLRIDEEPCSPAK